MTIPAARPRASWIQSIQLMLGIGLSELDLQPQVFADTPAFSFDIGQCLPAIDFWLPPAKQVQIWAVQNIDYRPHF